MAKKGVYVDLNQLADVLMKKKKKKRRRRKAVKSVPATQALQQETTRNAMIRTPYAQQTLYGSGNFNVAGDKFDAGIQAEKRVEGITQQISGIERMGARELGQLKEQLTGVESELQVIMDKSTEPMALRGRGRPKRNMSIRNRSGRKAVYKANAPVEAEAQVSANLNRPARPAVSTVGEGIATMGDGIISAEGKQGGGGVAPPAPYGFKPDGSPYKRKPKNFGMMTGIAEATPNYQNIILNKQEQKITDVLQGGGGDIGM